MAYLVFAETYATIRDRLIAELKLLLKDLSP